MRAGGKRHEGEARCRARWAGRRRTCNPGFTRRSVAVTRYVAQSMEAIATCVRVSRAQRVAASGAAAATTHVASTARLEKFVSGGACAVAFALDACGTSHLAPPLEHMLSLARAGGEGVVQSLRSFLLSFLTTVSSAFTSLLPSRAHTAPPVEATDASAGPHATVPAPHVAGNVPPAAGETAAEDAPASQAAPEEASERGSGDASSSAAVLPQQQPQQQLEEQGVVSTAQGHAAHAAWAARCDARLSAATLAGAAC